MKTVKFKQAGRWAEANPREPHFSVKAGEERPVSDALAKTIVAANAGTIVITEEEKAAAELKNLTTAVNNAKSTAAELKKVAEKTAIDAEDAEKLAETLTGTDKATAKKQAKQLRSVADKAAEDAKQATEIADKSEAELKAALSD